MELQEKEHLQPLDELGLQIRLKSMIPPTNETGERADAAHKPRTTTRVWTTRPRLKIDMTIASVRTMTGKGPGSTNREG